MRIKSFVELCRLEIEKLSFFKARADYFLTKHNEYLQKDPELAEFFQVMCEQMMHQCRSIDAKLQHLEGMQVEYPDFIGSHSGMF